MNTLKNHEKSAMYVATKSKKHGVDSDLMGLSAKEFAHKVLSEARDSYNKKLKSLEKDKSAKKLAQKN